MSGDEPLLEEREKLSLATWLGVLAGGAIVVQEHFHPPDTYHPQSGMLLWIGLAGGAGLLLGLLLRATLGRILISAMGGAAMGSILTMLLPRPSGESLNLFPLVIVTNTAVTSAGVGAGLLLSVLCKALWNNFKPE
jgi:hypothetical protein